MHRRRDEDRPAENCPWPSTEVQPGKTKVLGYQSSVGIGSVCVPQHHHHFYNPHPMFVGRKTFALALQGSLVQGRTIDQSSSFGMQSFFFGANYNLSTDKEVWIPLSEVVLA